MPEIFLSYSHKDLARAHRFAAALEAQGWDVFWDRHLSGGQSYDQVIADALAASSAVVVLWSENSSQSDWVRDEAEHAKARGLLVPVLIDDSRIPLGFGRLHTLDFSAWNGDAETAEVLELDRALRAISGAAATAPIATAGPTVAAQPTVTTAPSIGASAGAGLNPSMIVGGLISVAALGLVVVLAQTRGTSEQLGAGNGAEAPDPAASTDTTRDAMAGGTAAGDATTTAAPVRATVDEGSMIALDKRRPVIGTDDPARLDPPEYAPIRQLDDDVVAYVDRESTTNRQFYDFASFASAAVGVDADTVWRELVPGAWLELSPQAPSDFALLRLDDRGPVAGVSFATAQRFCGYAGKRLPTEVEWELAARDGAIDTSAVQNWVAAPEAYGPVPAGARVLRGSFGIEELPVFFRTIGDTPTNRLNAGIRCAADDVVEVPSPTGELLYAREFSGADVAHDWPDFHEAQEPDVAYGYHAPNVFHIELRNGKLAAVGSGTLHPDDVRISTDVEVRLPTEPGEGFRYGLVANSGADGYVALLVTDVVDASEARSLRWCAAQRQEPVLQVDQIETVSLAPPVETPCRLEGVLPVDSAISELAITISGGAATFSIGGEELGSFAEPHRTDATFGFRLENSDRTITSHIHYDNLAVAAL